MMTVTRDPMTLNEVTDLENAPFLIEGQGNNMMLIYFENEANRQAYQEMEMHKGVMSPALKKIFSDMANNPNTGSIN